MTETIYRARLSLPRGHIEAFIEAAAFLEPAPHSWEDVESGESWAETWDADLDALRERARIMADLAGLLDGRIHAAHIEEVQATDWTEEWKKYFHTTRVSERIIIHPVWDPLEAADDDIVIHIDPGLSFGTGLHPTTKSCLRFLDSLAREMTNLGDLTVLDIGCGSGILSIAAHKLGFGRIMALDNDPVAVKTSRTNIAANGVPEKDIVCMETDLYKDPLPAGDVVLANILAPVLIETAPAICAALAQRSATVLILSGILTEQFPEVSDVFRKHGLILQTTIELDNWTTGCFSRDSEI